MISDIEQQAAESNDLWKQGNKLCKFCNCFSLLPVESFQTPAQEEGIQPEPRVLSELGRQRWEFSEAKAVRICRAEVPEQRELQREGAPEIHRGFP